ncbi:MAG TPA: hypothetical protein VG142_16020 [Trebonia sp.]|nr:hypothetical protein [Trebonia sp.]
MGENEGFFRVVRSIIRREHVGHRLLAGYYVLALVVTVVGCALQPASAVIVVPAAFVIGILLLLDVSRATKRHLRPLLEHWPSLAILPSPPVVDLNRQRRRRGQAPEPHKGLGGGLYVTGLILLAFAGGLTTASAAMVDHPGASESGNIAFPSVMIVIVGPLCFFLWRYYERQVRKPYLVRLQYALSEAMRSGAPAPSKPPAPDAFGPHHHWRRGEIFWVSLWTLLLGLRVGVLILALVSSVASGVTAGRTAASSAPAPQYPSTPYPTPPVAHGIVTDKTAGITYAVPSDSGWSEDTETIYPPYGAEFTKVVPGTDGNDVAAVQSAPLPSNISYKGANGLHNALNAFFPTLVGTYDNTPHDDTITIDQAVTVCGRPGWLAVDKVHYTSGGIPDETDVLEVVSLPGSRPPATLFASIANTLGANAALDEVKTARPIGGHC